MIKKLTELSLLLIISLPCCAKAIPPIAFHVDHNTTKNITANIQAALNQYQKEQNFSSSNNKQYYFNNAQKVIKNAVMPFGYFNTTTQLQWKKVNGQTVPHIRITLGPPVRIQSITVRISGTGAQDHSFKYLQQHLPLKKHNILQTPVYNKIKTQLINTASNHGFFNAKMTRSAILINRTLHTARIQINFNTGPRYYFGKTTFIQTQFAPAFLKKYLAYRPGELFSNKQVQLTQQQLSNSGYFQQIQITPTLKTNHGHTIPITITLKPVAQRNYTIGLGYGSNTTTGYETDASNGTDIGIRAVGNIVKNYTGKFGHKIKLASQLSYHSTNISLGYTIPGPKPYQNQYNINGAFSTINQTTGHSNAVKFSGQYRVNSQHWDNLYSINILNEHYNLSTLQVKTNANMIYPSINWQYINTDNKLNPTRGFLAQIKLYGTPSFLSSKGSFFQSSLMTRWLTTFHTTHTRLLVFDEFAHTEIQSLANLPLSLQLFSGGPHTLRGYDYNSIGPGKSLFVAAVELQQKLYSKLYLTGFYDIGNVSSMSTLFSQTKSSVGGGLAWLSPIGMFELDYAIALNLPNKPGKIVFSVGPFL